MTLSSDTKDSLARDVPEAAHCREALLAGLALYGRRRSAFVTQRNAVARLFRLLLPRPAGEVLPHITKAASTRLSRTPEYLIALAEAPDVPYPAKPARRCDRVMELRGAFLACGSISAGSPGYHLEFVLRNAGLAARLHWMLRSVTVPPKDLVRRGHAVLYYKDFEAIVEFLTVVGAHGAVLHLEDVHALKETKNRIHRLVNTEAANLERTAAAAAAQREMIDAIVSAHGLARLSPALREIAQLRLNHPDESLAELGRRCNPPITKPSVNSRLGALARLERTLRGETAQAARKGR